MEFRRVLFRSPTGTLTDRRAPLGGEGIIERDRHPHQYVEERLVLRLAQNHFDDEIDAKRHGERRCYGCLFIAHGKVYPHADIDRVEDHSVKGDEPEDAVLQDYRKLKAVKNEHAAGTATV